MATPFAEYTDLEAIWRPLSADEEARATTLLPYASAFIRAQAPDVDQRILDGELDEAIPRFIACSMVKRILQSATALEGVSQQQTTAGPFSSGVSYSNPSGNLYLNKDERKLLGIGVQRAFTIDLIPSDESSSSSSSSS